MRGEFCYNDVLNMLGIIERRGREKQFSIDIHLCIIV